MLRCPGAVILRDTANEFHTPQQPIGRDKPMRILENVQRRPGLESAMGLKFQPRRLHLPVSHRIRTIVARGQAVTDSTKPAKQTKRNSI
jgi:hypothetical protein